MGWKWVDGVWASEAEHDERAEKRTNFLVRVVAIILAVYAFKEGNYIWGGVSAFFLIFPKLGCMLLIIGGVLAVALVGLAALFK